MSSFNNSSSSYYGGGVNKPQNCCLSYPVILNCYYKFYYFQVVEINTELLITFTNANGVEMSAIVVSDENGWFLIDTNWFPNGWFNYANTPMKVKVFFNNDLRTVVWFETLNELFNEITLKIRVSKAVNYTPNKAVVSVNDDFYCCGDKTRCNPCDAKKLEKSIDLIPDIDYMPYGGVGFVNKDIPDYEPVISTPFNTDVNNNGIPGKPDYINDINVNINPPPPNPNVNPPPIPPPPPPIPQPISEIKLDTTITINDPCYDDMYITYYEIIQSPLDLFLVGFTINLNIIFDVKGCSCCAGSLGFYLHELTSPDINLITFPVNPIPIVNTPTATFINTYRLAGFKVYGFCDGNRIILQLFTLPGLRLSTLKFDLLCDNINVVDSVNLSFEPGLVLNL